MMSTKKKRGVKAQHQTPPVVSQSLPVQDRGDKDLVYVVPEGEDLHVVYRKPQPVPCPSCRRLRMDHGSQACLVRTTKEHVVYMTCRCCGHLFEAPIV